MAISMYQISVPVFIRLLKNLEHILKVGEEYAREKEIEPEILFNSRLAPDMFPLFRQVQVASDVARRCIERLVDAEISSIEDNEKTFEDLYQRIANTVSFLDSVKPEQLDGTEDKPVSLQVRDHTFDLQGLGLLQKFSLPNVYFHVTTAYDILRHNGVGLGKKDFIGQLS